VGQRQEKRTQKGTERQEEWQERNLFKGHRNVKLIMESSPQSFQLYILVHSQSNIKQIGVFIFYFEQKRAGKEKNKYISTLKNILFGTFIPLCTFGSSGLRSDE
jgi:hypothetical protein